MILYNIYKMKGYLTMNMNERDFIELEEKDKKRCEMIKRLMYSNPLYAKARGNEDIVVNYLIKDSEFQEQYELENDNYLNELHASYWFDSLAIAIETQDWKKVADIIRGRYDFADNVDYCGKE